MTPAKTVGHRTILSRYGLIISAFLLFAFALVFSFQNLFDQKRLVDKESRINIWFVAQLEIEYLRLLNALDLYVVAGGGVDKEELLLRFDIYWSRLPVLTKGPQSEALRAVSGLDDTLKVLLSELAKVEPMITGLAKDDRKGYADLRSILASWQKPLHQTVLDALLFDTEFKNAERQSAEELYDQLMVFFAATCVGIIGLFLMLYREIRKSNLAESQASTAQAQLVEAIESISEAFVLFDDEDRVVLYNTKYKEFHPGFAHLVEIGVSFETLIRTGAERGAVTVDRGEIDTWVRDCVRQHRNPGEAFESQLSTGRWLKISERQTKHGWIVGVHSDITELKQRELELRQKSGLLEATLESINQGICVYDAEMGLLTWNDVYAEMFALPRELLSVGAKYVDTLRYKVEMGDFEAEDTQALIDRHLKNVEEIQQDGAGVRKIERRRANGGVIDITYYPMPGGGFVTTFTDITERVRDEEERSRLAAQFHMAQEENLRLLMQQEAAQRRSAEIRLVDAVESSSEGVILLDAQDRIVIANTQAAKFLPPVTDLMVPGRSLSEILLSAKKLGVFSPTTPGLSGEGARDSDSETELPLAGEVHLADSRWLRVSRSTTQDGGAVVIWSDITEMKQREETLREAKELAEAANASKTNFLSSMSHELRTPLNAVIGFSETMYQELFGPLGHPRYQEYASDILNSGRHLLDIINDILAFAKSEAGTLQLNIEDVDVPAVLTACRNIMHDQCEEAGVTLHVEPPSDRLRILADVPKLRQILLNVLSNAMKFTPQGGRISVRVGAAAEGGILLVVADTGIGMRAEDIPLALQPFQQIDSSLSRRYEGTGLGLPLTQKLVELHGGTLRIVSSPGAGTTVSIHIPSAPEQSAASTAAGTAPLRVSGLA